MSDFGLMVTNWVALGASAAFLAWAVRRSATVTREDEQMSREWIERMRGQR